MYYYFYSPIHPSNVSVFSNSYWLWVFSLLILGLGRRSLLGDLNIYFFQRGDSIGIFFGAFSSVFSLIVSFLGFEIL